MMLYNNIETELIILIKHRQEQKSVSERDSLISKIIAEKYYFNKPFEDQILFKETVEKLLFNYLTIDNKEPESITNAVAYYLLYVSMTVGIPIDNLLIDVLKNKFLVNRYYEDRDLVLTTLKLFLDIPITYRT